jgi:spore germination cell wall hydrolase CwlJ-like protein
MTALALEQPGLAVPDLIRRHWGAWTVLGAMVALWLVALVAVAVQSSIPRPAAEPIAPSDLAALRQVAAQTSATQIRQLAPDNAIAINAAIPVANLLNPAARPFTLALASAADRLRSLDCLTAAIYYEAATESIEGQRAVAQVVLNRVRHPAWPSTVCGVVFEGARRSTGCQFSFSCDGSLRRAPMAAYWERARTVAQAALNGYVYTPAGWATHYHADYVVPYWASSLIKSATVGRHIFYRWRGGWGRPAAFLSRYAGVEPNIAWRGGFGQPVGGAVQLAAARDAAAAEAAAAAAGHGDTPLSVDSFQRAVLRRYEPLQRESATAVIAERTRADRTLSTSQRWALTGTNESSSSDQAPLGRNGAEQPRELQGVRRRWDPAATPERERIAAPAAADPAPARGTETSASGASTESR